LFSGEHDVVVGEMRVSRHRWGASALDEHRDHFGTQRGVDHYCGHGVV
jgi:hypothetical protein